MKKSKYTKEILTKNVEEVNTLSDLVRKLTNSDKVHGSMVAYIKNKLLEYNIDFSHFNGKGWSKNKQNPTGIALTVEQFKKDYLTKDSIKKTCSTNIKNWIIKFKLIEYKCENCTNDGEWLNKKLCLQLDHINGDNSDNRLENLRFLCPNCHSQTETYTGKNNK